MFINDKSQSDAVAHESRPSSDGFMLISEAATDLLRGVQPSLLTRPGFRGILW